MQKTRLLLTVFSLPLFSIAMAGYRVPAVISDHGSQQFRSLLAAFEILTATVVSNAIIINSFARGKGTKRRKPSGDRGIDDGEGGIVRNAYWGSDDDLIRQVGGCRAPGIAPVQKGYGFNQRSGEFPVPQPVVFRATISREKNVWGPGMPRHDSPITPPPSPKRGDGDPVLYDVGGLLENGESDYMTDQEGEGQGERPRSSISWPELTLKDIVEHRRRNDR
jgi:hypothetical protein